MTYAAAANGTTATIAHRGETRQAFGIENTITQLVGMVRWADMYATPEITITWSGIGKPAEILAALRDAHYSVSDAGVETGWFTIVLDRTRAVHLGLTRFIQQTRTPLFQVGANADTIAVQLSRFHQLTGAPWRMTGGASGHAGIRAWHERKTKGGIPLWRWDAALKVGAVGCSWEPRSVRTLTDAERQHSHMHYFDRRSAYLSSMINAELGWGRLIHQGPGAFFEPKSAGYWLIDARRVRALDGDMGGIPIDQRATAQPFQGLRMWVTTATLAYHVERGGTLPEILDAWVADRTGRVLRGWGEEMRDAIAETRDSEPEMNGTLKSTYARSVGSFAKPGGRIFRPDWRDTVVDLDRVTGDRAAAKVVKAFGMTPVRRVVDGVWYPGDPGDAGEILATLGGDPSVPTEATQTGKFRHVMSITMQEWLSDMEGRRV